eukprot:5457764-Amphidinium_carterae.1
MSSSSGNTCAPRASCSGALPERSLFRLCLPAVWRRQDIKHITHTSNSWRHPKAFMKAHLVAPHATGKTEVLCFTTSRARPS